MNAIEWISLLSSVGVLITAMIAAFTLNELFRQRKASYKPDLCVLKNTFGIPTNEIDINLTLREEFNVAVVNVGSGVAKNIVAKWAFDMEKLLDEVNNLAQKTHQSFYIERSEYLLSINDNGSTEHIARIKMEIDKFDYLLPLSQDNTGKKIRLPSSYIFLVALYLSFKAPEKTEFDGLKIPLLTLELSYSDIGKGKHKTKHKIQCMVILIKVKNELPFEFGVELTEIS